MSHYIVTVADGNYSAGIGFGMLLSAPGAKAGDEVVLVTVSPPVIGNSGQQVTDVTTNFGAFIPADDVIAGLVSPPAPLPPGAFNAHTLTVHIHSK